MEETQSAKIKASKGTKTLYRVAYQSQIALIRMADSKANLIIAMNTLIISIIIAISGYGLIAAKFQQDKTSIMVPVALILLSCLVSTLFAIQVTKPKLILQKPLDLHKTKSSLLFFGTISRYSQEEFLKNMDELITSDQHIYENMNIDLYNQGLILNRKYELLNRAYRIFMFGFVASVWIFLAFMMVA